MLWTVRLVWDCPALSLVVVRLVSTAADHWSQERLEVKLVVTSRPFFSSAPVLAFGGLPGSLLVN